MKLECESFYFYPNGEYETTSNWNYEFQSYDNDIKEYGRAIRIFGTRKQIDEALDAYCEATGLNLDEVYDFEDKESIKRYTEIYKNKALIINIK